MESRPEIVTRGFIAARRWNGSCWTRRALSSCGRSSSRIQRETDWSVIKEKIRIDLKRFSQQADLKRPLILPVILEV